MKDTNKNFLPAGICPPSVHYDHFRSYVGISNRKWLKVLSQLLYKKSLTYQNKSQVQLGFSMMLDAMQRYEDSGQQVICVGPQMQKSFANCPIDRIPRNLLWDKRLYDSLYVAYPNSDIELWGGDESRWHKLAGAYVYWINEYTIQIFAWGLPKGRDASNDATFWITINLKEASGEKQDTDASLGLEKEDNSFIDMDLYIERMIDPAYGRGYTEAGKKLMVSDKKRLNKNTRSLVRSLVNCLIYATANNAELSSIVDNSSHVEGLYSRLRGIRPDKKSAVKLRQKLRKKTTGKVCWLGLSLESEMRKIEREREKGESTDKVAREEHWRKGHWHRYYVGPKKDAEGNKIPDHKREIITKFVPPVYVKGVQRAEMQPKIHLLAGDKK